MTATGGRDFGPEVQDYARDVRAALADVPAERKAELLEDLEEHLVVQLGEVEDAQPVLDGGPADLVAGVQGGLVAAGQVAQERGAVVAAHIGQTGHGGLERR